MKSDPRRFRGWTILLAGMMIVFGLSTVMSAQPVISVKGGLVNAVEGKADFHAAKDMRLQKLEPFLQLHRGDEVQVRQYGRVEILLNPGSFARLGSESRLRLVNDQLSSLSLELLDGSMVIEAGNVKAIRQIEVKMANRSYYVIKDGIYRFDRSDSGAVQARVFRGEMTALDGRGKLVHLKKSRAMSESTNGVVTLAHFDTHQTDNLDSWSAYRAGLLERANVGVVRAYRNGYAPWDLHNSSLLYGGGWFYNPFYGTYTFWPGYSSFYYSPYGYHYYPPNYGYGGGGGGGGVSARNRNEGYAGNRESLGSSSAGVGKSSESHIGGSMIASPSAGMGRSEAPSGGAGRHESVRKH